MISITNSLAAWTVVLASGLLEVVFSVAMKLSDSYTRLVPSALSIIAAMMSVWLMSFTLKILPLGTAYAVWAGIGAAGTALDAMWEGRGSKPDWSKTELAQSFSPKEHANGCA